LAADLLRQAEAFGPDGLDGGTLTAKLHNNKKAFGKPFSFPQYLSYCKQFADALAYMHTGWLPDATIIHRGAFWWKGMSCPWFSLTISPDLVSPSLLLRSDLKPDNIGFSADGTLKLLDFGLCVCVRRRSSSTDAYKMTGTCVRTYGR
jgi:serine/threonine protein kinase